MFIDFFYSSNGFSGRNYEIEPKLLAQYFSSIFVPFGFANYISVYLVGSLSAVLVLFLAIQQNGNDSTVKVFKLAKQVLVFYLMGVGLYLWGIYFPHTMQMHRYYYIYSIVIALLLVLLTRNFPKASFVVLFLLLIQLVGLYNSRYNFSKKRINYPNQVVAIGLTRGEFSFLVSKLDDNDRLAYFPDLSIEEFDSLKFEKGTRVVFGRKIAKNNSSPLLNLLKVNCQIVSLNQTIELDL